MPQSIPNFTSSLQPSSETTSLSVKDNNSFKSQLSSAHEPRFGPFQSRNLYRTKYDTPKFRAGGVYNVEHGKYIDYNNEESIHKIKNKQSYAENSTLPFTTEYKQKRSVNISIEYDQVRVNSQKTGYVGKSVRRENDPVSERSIYNLTRAKCKTKRPLVKSANHFKGETRTRVRRSGEKQENYVIVDNKHATENSDKLQGNKQIVAKPGTEELPVARIYPQYFIYTWVLCMVALASFLKLNYLVKTIVLIFMVTCYGILIINFRSEISQCYR